jgi:hypothetical protein
MLEVVLKGSNTPVVDISGTITLGGTAQTISTANPGRTGYLIRNNSAVSLWVSDLTTAVQSQPSLEIKAGELWETPLNYKPIGAISIIGSTTSQAFTAREW